MTAGLEGELARPPRESLSGRVVHCLTDGPEQEADYATGRILNAADPAWPGEPWEPTLLQLWPAERRLIGARLQALHSTGALERLDAAPKVLRPSGSSEESEDLARDLARDWARYYDLDPRKPAVLDAATWEVFSLGRGAARARFAALEEFPNPTVALLAQASRLSLHPESDPAEFEEVLTAYHAAGETEELWPALARHISRRATEKDRTLLEDLARHPEKREPPLSWGLKYIVRGDTLLESGEVIQLDDLSREHGLEPLPYLEKMPPELEVDWDAEDDK